MEINRIQLILLSILKKSNANSPATGVSIAHIQSLVNLGKSYSTIHRCLSFLEYNELVRQGVKDGKYNTFYISQQGEKIIKEMI